METFTLKTLTHNSINLLIKAIVEIKKTKELIFDTGVNKMLKKLFEAIEAIFRAAIYLLILLMGLSVAALGSYTIIFLSIRLGQFLFELLFREKWL
ncbi:MAG: hypothetical protein K8R02_07805 [Anaerohalosphaeraceae bacterium]|nr:hypothetical protein [Anaerohalosphaeraceae bacterium]